MTARGRKCNDWLKAFMEYCEGGEAPRHMYFWAGVSTIAGALRRQVWLDEKTFKWYCNLYIILVAPPGIVSKSTTAGLGMDLLRKVPGIRFGPNVVTWQSLVTKFAEATEGFEYKGDVYPMSAMTLEASEFGNLFDPKDTKMVDLFVALWDGKQGAFEKTTKGSGDDVIENPWINMIACTTPSWIADNFPKYMIGGGFASRCLFVYAEQKARLIAYPSQVVSKNFDLQKQALIDDLAHISQTLKGEYVLTKLAREWGSAWYTDHYARKTSGVADERFGGYFARKQSQFHKVAMIIAASESDELVITEKHLAVAATMVTDLESDMAKVYEKIGRSEKSEHVDRFLWFVKAKATVSYTDAYKYVHAYFPSMREFEDMVAGCVRSGQIQIRQQGNGVLLIWVGETR